jgi:ribonuclease Z
MVWHTTMRMKIVFLGTSCMIPTAQRNTSALLLSFRDENILFDCGEGTQRQMRIARIKPTKITRIMISHWHGDHVLGLPGLIQTLGASEYSGVLEIYGPSGSKAHLKQMLAACVYEQKIDIKVTEVDKPVFLETDRFSVEARELVHPIPCVGFRFVEKDRRRMRLDCIRELGVPEGPLLGELQKGQDIVFSGKRIAADAVTRIVKGKVVSYIADTLMCDNAVELARDADVLISEAAFDSSLEEKAREYSHLTAQQAAMIAQEGHARKLVLTHFSQRYKDTEKLEKEAAAVFPDVVCAEDFMEIRV